MSASREKKKRQAQPVEATPVVQQKKGMNKSLKTVLISVIAIVLVAAVVFLGMVTGGYFETHSTAAVASSHNLTPAMVNYYYTTAYGSDAVQQYLSLFADTTLPLDEQECPLMPEGGTWSDYTMEYALNMAANTYAIYDEALRNNHTLSQESSDNMTAELENLAMTAAMYGFNSPDGFLSANYGRGCNLDNYKEFLEVTYMAQDYTNAVTSEFSFTQEEVDAHYAENRADFDTYDYRIFNVYVQNDSEDEEAEVDAEALAACEETAKAMAEAAQGDDEAFVALALENAHEDEKANYEDANATLRTGYLAAQMSENFREWMTDEARVEGDTTYVANDTENGYYVVSYIGMEDYNYQLPNVRHILLSVSDPSDTAAMEAAKKEAENLLQQFLTVGKTEEAFAELANEKSDDTGSNTTGGLYENLVPGATVEAFNDWCFNETRAAGDTGIVETEYGYHVMYFSGFGRTYRDYMVESTMLNSAFTEWQDSFTVDMDFELISDRYVETR